MQFTSLTKILRRCLIGGLAVLAAGGPAVAASFPDKPVKLVHAYPGFALDAVMRAASTTTVREPPSSNRAVGVCERHRPSRPPRPATKDQARP